MPWIKAVGPQQVTPAVLLDELRNRGEDILGQDQVFEGPLWGHFEVKVARRRRERLRHAGWVPVELGRRGRLNQAVRQDVVVLAPLFGDERIDRLAEERLVA